NLTERKAALGRVDRLGADLLAVRLDLQLARCVHICVELAIRPVRNTDVGGGAVHEAAKGLILSLVAKVTSIHGPPLMEQRPLAAARVARGLDELGVGPSRGDNAVHAEPGGIVLPARRRQGKEAGCPASFHEVGARLLRAAELALELLAGSLLSGLLAERFELLLGRGALGQLRGGAGFLELLLDVAVVLAGLRQRAVDVLGGL